MSGAVNIDLRPYVSAECGATISRDASGRPTLAPGVRDLAGWVGGLTRLLGKQDSVRARVVIEREKPARSLAANRYLWLCYETALQQIAAQAAAVGLPCPFRNTEDMHEWWATKHLGVEERVMPGGEVVALRKHSRTLDGAQFGGLIEAFVAEMAQREVFIPPPGEFGIEETWKGSAA